MIRLKRIIKEKYQYIFTLSIYNIKIEKKNTKICCKLPDAQFIMLIFSERYETYHEFKEYRLRHHINLLVVSKVNKKTRSVVILKINLLIR